MTDSYPWGYISVTEVTPKPPPVRLHWRVGPVAAKTAVPAPTHRPPLPPTEGNITVQLTADQQVTLSVSGEDAYGNEVDLDAVDAQWVSSDEAIITLTSATGDETTAVAVGPVGTASVTVSSGDGQYQGSLAIDVVAGQVTEIVIEAGEPENKP